MPLRILGLGKQPTDRVDADVFLLTDQTPDAPARAAAGLSLAYNARRRARSCSTTCAPTRAWSWVPQSAWLTQVRVDSNVADLRYDLAVDASGLGKPSSTAAGLETVSPAPHAIR